MTDDDLEFLRWVAYAQPGTPIPQRYGGDNCALLWRLERLEVHCTPRGTPYTDAIPHAQAAARAWLQAHEQRESSPVPER